MRAVLLCHLRWGWREKGVLQGLETPPHWGGLIAGDESLAYRRRDCGAATRARLALGVAG